MESSNRNPNTRLAYVIDREPKPHEPSKCWNCKKAFGGCSWSRDFKVPSKAVIWEAIIEKKREGRVKRVHIWDCPEYVKSEGNYAEESKVCRSCKSDKPISEYRVLKSGKMSSVCAECERKKGKK